MTCEVDEEGFTILSPGWLDEELKSINAEIEAWSIGLRESFEGLKSQTVTRT